MNAAGTYGFGPPVRVIGMRIDAFALSLVVLEVHGDELKPSPGYAATRTASPSIAAPPSCRPLAEPPSSLRHLRGSSCPT